MTRVAIIGGGIGGLAAARALSRRGFEVAIYESTPELREIGAGVALGPNAMNALRSLDLDDEVRAIAGRSEWRLVRNWKTGRVISRISREAQAAAFGSASATVHRADLLDLLAEVLERYSGWNESLRRIFSASETWYKWALYDRDPISQWTRGRVTLLGDAAHPMLPYLGQGACQAIEDGCVLASALCAHLDDPVAALALYERSRLPRASRVVLTSRERGMSNHLVSPLAALKRDLSIAFRRRLGRDPEGRGAAWIDGYDASSPDVLAV